MRSVTRSMSLVTIAPAVARERRDLNRRLLVDVVDVDDPGGGQELRRQLVGAQRDGVVAAPEHHPLAGALVDEDDGELVRAVMDDGIGDVDAARARAPPARGCRCRRSRSRRRTSSAGRARRRPRARSPSGRRTRPCGWRCGSSSAVRRLPAGPAGDRRSRRKWRQSQSRPTGESSGKSIEAGSGFRVQFTVQGSRGSVEVSSATMVRRILLLFVMLSGRFRRPSACRAGAAGRLPAW